MKRYSFIILTLFLSVNIFAQNIEFMGLSLNTDLNTFCKNLKSKGLTQTIDRFEEKEFEGTFATYPKCKIIVKGTADKKKIQSVEVIFESVRNDKYERDRAFNELLTQYKNKYKDNVKKMPTDDATKMMNFEKSTISIGTTEIHIQKFGPTIFDTEGECSMSIVYVNTSVPKEEKTSNYSNDI